MKLIYLFCIVIISVSHAFAGEAYVYLNNKNKEDLSLVNLKKIIRAQKLNWISGEDILLFVDDIKKTDNETFRSFSGVTKSEFIDNWRIKFFTGRAMTPIQARDQNTVMESLLENPFSIYVTFDQISPDLISGQSEIRMIAFPF